MAELPDKEALTRLRKGLDALRTHDGRGPAHANVLALARELPDGVGVTIDLSAEQSLGQPIVVLRPSRARAAEFDALSPRELEVAALVAKGLRNKEIAEVLTIKLGTAKDHVHKILVKTGFGTRAEVAAAWTE